MKEFKCYLLDMDGTVYLGGRLIDGAAEAIERMRKKGRVLFLTNNTSCSRAVYALRLRALGIRAEISDIFTAGNATVLYLKENYPDKKVWLLGTPSLKEEFQESGVRLVDDDPDVAVVGYDTTLTYDKLAKLCGFIRSGLPFIATHADINCPTADGFVPDVGSFLKLIEASAGKAPLAVCGKPDPITAKAVCSLCGAKGKEVAMIGDRLYTDMRFAVDNGFYSVLVLSGETKREDLAACPFKIDRVLGSIAQIE